jgi:hypothetical protein
MQVDVLFLIILPTLLYSRVYLIPNNKVHVTWCMTSLIGLPKQLNWKLLLLLLLFDYVVNVLSEQPSSPWDKQHNIRNQTKKGNKQDAYEVDTHAHTHTYALK